MKNLFALLLLTIAAGAAFAQAPAANDQLYKSFGEKKGLVSLMDDFMPRLVADARTGPFFKSVDQKHVKEQLAEQFCQLSGGPCNYEGQDMKTTHMKMQITRGDFNALVEILQVSMDAQGIPFAAQNQLLARLAPMHRAIITTEK